MTVSPGLHAAHQRIYNKRKSFTAIGCLFYLCLKSTLHSGVQVCSDACGTRFGYLFGFLIIQVFQLSLRAVNSCGPTVAIDVVIFCRAPRDYSTPSSALSSSSFRVVDLILFNPSACRRVTHLSPRAPLYNHVYLHEAAWYLQLN